MNGNEWRTPASVFSYWDKQYNFALDAAATSKNAKCQQFCSKEPGQDDGLKTGWALKMEVGQYAWLNPPFSAPLNWVRKAIKEQSRGFGCVICLNADFTTKAVGLALRHAQEAHITVSEWDQDNYYSGRVSFDTPDGKPGDQNRQGQVFFVFHPFGKNHIQFYPLPITQCQPEKRAGVYQQPDHEKEC